MRISEATEPGTLRMTQVPGGAGVSVMLRATPADKAVIRTAVAIATGASLNERAKTNPRPTPMKAAHSGTLPRCSLASGIAASSTSAP